MHCVHKFSFGLNHIIVKVFFKNHIAQSINTVHNTTLKHELFGVHFKNEYPHSN